MISLASRVLGAVSYISDSYSYSAPLFSFNASTGATVIPIKQRLTWDQDVTPDLVIGDTFWHRVTLLYGMDGAPFDFSSASDVSVAVVARDHSQIYSAIENQSPAKYGAAWDTGVLSLYLSPETTLGIAEFITEEMLADVEIQVTLSGDKYSWFGVVNLIPGYVS